MLMVMMMIRGLCSRICFSFLSLYWLCWTPNKHRFSTLKVSFMTYLVHMDFNYWFFFSQVKTSNIKLWRPSELLVLDDSILFFSGLPLGLQPPDKCLHVSWQPGGGSFIWPPLLHWDGVTFGKTAKDHHWCLCYQDDQRAQVDIANFLHFHCGHSLHCCQRFGQVVEKGPGWGSRIESFRMVVQQSRVHTIYFHTNILCSVFVQ